MYESLLAYDDHVVHLRCVLDAVRMEKVKTIQDWSSPKNISEVRRVSIGGLWDILALWLHLLMNIVKKKNVGFKWGEKTREGLCHP